jgi:hypothetical protein
MHIGFDQLRTRLGISFRQWLVRVGEHLAPSRISSLKAVVRYLEVGSMMSQLGYKVGRIKPLVERREELFDLVGREIGDRQVLYLEFGVFQGRTIAYWSRLLKNPNSQLHGFDSFEGLPESWNGLPKGTFSANGVIPTIDDPRVTFFKGWFDESLACYELPSHEALVINIDADLYSSARTVLARLLPHITPGTYIYFDEFIDPQHELRAFMEFASSVPRKFALRGATKRLLGVMFQCVE